MSTIIGNSKNARNTLYSFSATIIAKIGSLFLTILLTRLLHPELFGIYSLVLSIVLIVFTFTDLGINSAENRYVSFFLGKGKAIKARSHLRYLLKIKIFLVVLAIIAMVALAPILSFWVYDKPILLYPLLFATFYIAINSFRSFFESLYYPTRDLSKYPVTTFILHGLRLLLAAIALTVFSREYAVVSVFLAFSLASLLALGSVMFFLGKRRGLIFGKTVKIQKKKVRKYLEFMSIAAVSLVFFGSIDTLMLGYFVDPEFIGFYRAALGLIVSIAAILSLSNIFIPVFTQTKNKNLKESFDKAFQYLLTLSIPAAIGIVAIGRYAIHVIYGAEYAASTQPFYVLALLVIVTPLIKLYSSIFESRERTKAIAKITVISLIVNVILNYTIIRLLLQLGQTEAIIGAAIATFLSQITYVALLHRRANKVFEISLPLKRIAKPLFAAIVMGAVLFYYNSIIDINILTGLIEILIGILVYGIVLLAIGGIKKHDINLIKSIFKRS